MRKSLFILLAISFLISSCDDGDIINVELDFDETLSLCGDENSANYVLYNIKNDPYESLTLLFPVSEAETIFNPLISGEERFITINENSVKFNYRTYNGDPEGELICQDIPGSSVAIIKDYAAASGAEAKFTSTFIDDDNDGVPTEDENPDPNNDGDFSDAQDTDSDGIPDYIDEDDDNDNVLTINENPDINNDGNISDAQDTDGDTIPDYLDADDDGDGVLTRNEDENLDTNPRNDLSINNIARYLDAVVADEFIQNELIENSYERAIFVKVVVLNADLSVLSTDFIDFGAYLKKIIIND
ncbi:hypothetical protein [Pontimicrobium aquaticum]|uniref:Uncharacterized protein n=1 Tax=Pontimicrobium aquaticum TaxID=2565367 RepID=A0A4U0EQU8_9FLAO|nr:hypothetical protein [Pontimicrobium aquaticum]TJY34057.1 hypothetical protein E5167_12125 [Pontimicrobium aquaticum]